VAGTESGSGRESEASVTTFAGFQKTDEGKEDGHGDQFGDELESLRRALSQRAAATSERRRDTAAIHIAIRNRPSRSADLKKSEHE